MPHTEPVMNQSSHERRKTKAIAKAKAQTKAILSEQERKGNVLFRSRLPWDYTKGIGFKFALLDDRNARVNRGTSVSVGRTRMNDRLDWRTSDGKRPGKVVKLA
jgi:hypothetical protein